MRNAEKPVEAVIEVFDPCQTTPDFRVERLVGGDILRIKATPKHFACLQVKQPFTVHDLPIKVTAGNCVAPVSKWIVAFPDKDDGFRRVILRREEPEAAVCLQEHPKSSQLVVALCNASSEWKFESVPPP